MTGCGCASCIGRRSRSCRVHAASLARASPGRSRWSSASGLSPTACVFLKVPAFTMSSTLVCSSRSAALLRRRRRLYLRCTTLDHSIARNAFYACSYTAGLGMSPCTGRAWMQRRPLGNLSTNSRLSSLTSSSRTSCFSRGGEMLWWGTFINGARRDVAEEWAAPCHASARSPTRARHPRRQEFVSRSI